MCVVLLPAWITVHGKCFRCVAPGHDAFVPRHAELFGGDAGDIGERARSEVSDSCLNAECSIGPDYHEPVIAARARVVRAVAQTYSGNDCAPPLPAEPRLIAPVEGFLGLVEELLREGGRKVLAVLAVRRLVGWGVDTPDCEAIDPELLGRVVDDGLEYRRKLNTSR